MDGASVFVVLFYALMKQKQNTCAIYIYIFSVCFSHIAFIPGVYFFIINMTQLHY
jgi:hypothetical protein